LDSNPLVWTLTKPMKENPEFFQMSPGRDSSPCEIHAPCSAHEDPGMGEPLKDWRYTEAFLCDLTSAQESSTSRLSRRIEALEMAFADRRDQGQGLSVEVKDLQEQVQKTSELVYRVEMAHANLAQLVHGSQQKLDIIQRAHCSDVGALHERVQELRDLLEFDIGHGQGEKFPGLQKDLLALRDRMDKSDQQLRQLESRRDAFSEQACAPHQPAQIAKDLVAPLMDLVGRVGSDASSQHTSPLEDITLRLSHVVENIGSSLDNVRADIEALRNEAQTHEAGRAQKSPALLGSNYMCGSRRSRSPSRHVSLDEASVSGTSDDIRHSFAKTVSESPDTPWNNPGMCVIVQPVHFPWSVGSAMLPNSGQSQPVHSSKSMTWASSSPRMVQEPSPVQRQRSLSPMVTPACTPPKTGPWTPVARSPKEMHNTEGLKGPLSHIPRQESAPAWAARARSTSPSLIMSGTCGTSPVRSPMPANVSSVGGQSPPIAGSSQVRGGPLAPLTRMSSSTAPIGSPRAVSIHNSHRPRGSRGGSRHTMPSIVTW